MRSIHVDELFLSRPFPLALLLQLPSFFSRVFNPKSEICQRLKGRHAEKAPLVKCLGSGGCGRKSSVLASRDSPLRTGYPKYPQSRTVDDTLWDPWRWPDDSRG